MQGRLTTWLPLAVLAMLGLLAAFGRYFETLGADGTDAEIPDVIAVTSRADRGPGSLRSALFLAMKAPQPVAIELRVPLIELEVPLPPLAARPGLRIEGSLPAPTVIEYVSGGTGESWLVEIVADDVRLANLHLDANGANGIDVRGARTELDGVGISDAAVGLRAVNPDRLGVRRGEIRNNAEGLRVEGRSGPVALRDNQFRDNELHAIWAVFAEADDAASTVVIHDNDIRGGRHGLVAANAVADLRGNRVTGSSNAGLLLIDTRAVVSENRLLDGEGIGLHLADLRDSFVTNNEIGHNALVGILVVDARGLQVDGNEVYGNGYGIAAVGRQPIAAALRNNTLVDQSIDGLIAIGDTPLIDGNRAFKNRQAGIRILDLLLPDQPLIAASPRLVNNELSGNGNDEVLYGRYVVDEP